MISSIDMREEFYNLIFIAVQILDAFSFIIPELFNEGKLKSKGGLSTLS